MERLEQTSMERETRPNVAEVTLDAIGDYGLTGSGGGSFYTILPAYHDGSWRGFYDLAYIDFLQFPLEFGIPAYIILGSWCWRQPGMLLPPCVSVVTG